MHWGKVILHGLILVTLFLLGAILVNPLTDGIENDVLRIAVKELLRIGLTIAMIWLYARFVLEKPMKYFRIHKWAKKDRMWIIVGLAMPVAVITLYLITQFVAFERIEMGLGFVVISLISACSAGIIEELLFRGYLLKLFEEKWNVVTAVSITSILFAVLHLLTVNGQQLIDISLLLFAGSLVGVLFSLLVYKTGNVWSAVAVHIGWNFLMNPQMVQFSPLKGDSQSSFVLMLFQSDSVWLTGGAFGVEAALPAIILYVLMIGWLAFYKKR